MTKPLGFYVNHHSGRASLFNDMEESWGNTFDKLNFAEKAWMIYQLGFQLWEVADDSVSEFVEAAIKRGRSELSTHDKLDLIVAITSQLKDEERNKL